MRSAVARSQRMRPAALPFTDSFTRGDGEAEDTDHPWWTPVNPVGQRLEISSDKVKLAAAGDFADAFLETGDIELDIAFTMTAGTIDTQLIVFRNDPTIRQDSTAQYLFAWSGVTRTYSLIYRASGVDTYAFTSALDAMTAGSDYAVRLVITSTQIQVIVDAVTVFYETLRFAPGPTQTAFSITANDTTGAFDDIVVSGSSGTVLSDFYDNFDRPDGAPGNGFFATYGTVLPIALNKINSAGVSSGDLARDVGQKDFDLTFNYTRSVTSNNLFMVFRGTTTNTASLFYLQANGGGGTFTVTQRDRPVAGGSFTDTTVYSGSCPAETTGIWRVRAAGTAFQAWLNGSSVATATLPADKTNQADVLSIDGLRPSSTGITVDNYSLVLP